jgi:WD40 repeat protein
MSDHSPSDADPLGQIADEFVEAFRQGKRPAVEEFVRRYPAHAEQIREMLPALVLMEKARTAADPPGARRPAAAAAPLQQLGDYEILREVGRGGMGVVYEAQQLSLGRHVALKVLPAHALLDPRQLGRFQREARAAARLHHTNIVPVFGVGEQDGLHYYVMQFIHGLGLDAVLTELQRLAQPRGRLPRIQDDAPGRPSQGPGSVSAVQVARALLSGEGGRPGAINPRTAAFEEPPGEAPDGPAPPGRAADTSATIHLPGQADGSALTGSGRQYWQSVGRIGVQVAEALAHAASQGILHRDIKPSNLLLDAQGTVWVTDFGLAKADSDGDNLTNTGDIVGTLRYMAPERFDGRGDLRSDVYGLGLTLYELLTLRPAFDEADRNKLVKQVVHDEPVRPRKLNPAVPRDLETVVLKAIARDPAHRYQTPGELAADLKRFVDDEPIKARRLSLTGRLVRWSRRHKALAAALGSIFLLLILLAVGALLVAKQQSDQAVTNRKLAQESEAARKAAETMVVDLYTAQGLMAGERDDPAQAVLWFANAARLAGHDPLRQEVNRIRAHTWGRQICSPVHACYLPKSVHSPFLRLAFHPSGRYLLAQRHDNHCTVWDLRKEEPMPFPAPETSSAAWSPDGQWLAVGQPRGGFTLARFPSGAEVERVAFAGAVRHLLFSPDGQLLAVASDRSVRVWECRAHRFITPVLAHPASIESVVFHPGGHRLATGCQDGFARVFPIAADAPRPLFAPVAHDRWAREYAARNPVPPVFLDAGKQLLTASKGQLLWWDADTGAQSRSVPIETGIVGVLAASADGRYLAVVSGFHEGIAQIFESASGRAVSSVLKHRDVISSAVFSPDGNVLLTGSVDRTVRLWAVPTGTPTSPPIVHCTGIWATAFSADGAVFATGQGDGQLRVYTTPGSNPRSYRAPLGGLGSFVRFSPDGKYLLASGLTNGRCSLVRTQVREVAGGKPAGKPLEPGGVILDAAFAPGGSQVATASGRTGPSRVTLWDWRTGNSTALPLPSEPRSLAYSPDGWRLAALCAGGELVVVDPHGGQATAQWQPRPPLHGSNHYATNGTVCFGPDGRTVWVWGIHPEYRVFDPQTGQLRYVLDLGGGGLGLAFSPDGRHVVTTGSATDTPVRIWDYETGKPSAEPIEHPDWVLGAAFHPDGRHLVTACRDRMARVWDWRQGRLVSPPLEHRDAVFSGAFTPDGRWLATASFDKTARLWDWRTGRPVTPPLPLTGQGLQLAVAASGRYVAVGGFVTTLEVINLDDLYEDGPRDADALCLWAELGSGQRVHTGGGVTNLTRTEWLDRWREFRQRSAGTSR